MFADYHVHSYFSEDTDFPMELEIQKAIELGMDELCFTEHSDYDMTDPKYFARNGLRIPTKSDFFPGRFQVEVQGPPYEGMIHIHYNDLRLEVPISVYKKILDTMNSLKI